MAVNHKTKLSIIVPIYNAEKFLEQCLNSIAAQSYANFECIMVDDGSTDRSGEISRKFAASDERFKYYYQNNAGVSVSRNYGVSLATGEFVGFCDADDFIEPDMYECLMFGQEKHQSEIAGCALMFDKGERAVLQKSGEEKALTAEDALRFLFMGNQYGGVEVVCRIYAKSLICDIPFRNDIKIGEDLDFMVRAICGCKRILYIDTVKYHYCIHDDSAYHSVFHERFWTLQDACRSVLQEVNSRYPQLEPYAQKCLLDGNFTIITKLCCSGLLDKTSYRRIKNEIKPCANKAAMKLLSRKRRLAVRLFLASRWLFLLSFKLTRKRK